MKLTVLCDNNTYIDRYYKGEPAFSCLIEDGKKTVLFDTGYSDVYLENADAMQLDLGSVTDIALSHGHNDHTGGLGAFFSRFITPVTLTACPEVFDKKHLDTLEIGSPLSREDLPGNVSLRLTKDAIPLTEHVTFLGFIPRVCPFEQNRAVGERLVCGKAVPDNLPEDTALTLLLPKGQFIVTGCSHSGIVNICERALSLYPDKPILGILGGFHLRKACAESEKTAIALSSLVQGTLYPCHCTCLDVKMQLAHYLPVKEVGVSLQLLFAGNEISDM